MTITAPRARAPRADVECGVAGGELAAMLAMLHAVLDDVVWLEPDRMHSHEPAGHALLTLAAAARAAVAVLGGEPGTALQQGVGVVVVRDLVQAATRLERSSPNAPTADDCALLAGLTRGAAEARDRFRAFAPAPA